MKTKVIYIALAFGIVSLGKAQTNFCGTSELYNKQVIDNPAILTVQQQLDQYTQQYEQQLSAQKTTQATTYVIPVVFHILHNYGAENISDAQIYDEMVVLNKDYSRQNADTNLVITEFKSKIGTVNFVFRLAQKDAYGNCTNGIERIPTLLTYNGDDNAKDIVDHNKWPRNMYLNIYIVAVMAGGSAAPAAYAYLPASAQFDAAHDGIITRQDYVGSIGTSSVNTSRTITHEIGHFFNLAHTWGGTNQPGVSCGDDGVSDTPLTKGYNYCPTSSAVAKICSASIVENYQNFMDYSYCSHMFTINQASRMQAAATSSTAARSSLWQSSNLTNTGTTGSDNLCTADFLANKTVACPNSTITFTDNSWNGPTSWSWSFPGGTPSTGNTASVPVVYPTAGTYNVSLTVTNGSGSKSVTKTSLVNIYSATAQYMLPFSEGFEGVSSLPNANWTTSSSNGKYPWTTTTSASYTGTTSAWMNNNSNDTTIVNALMSPTFDCTSLTKPYLFYRVAYAQYDASSNDVLKILVSKDCGVTWAVRSTKSGVNLKTVPPQTAAFKPTSAGQWRLDSVSLNAYSTAKNVRIKFELTNANGNNIYLDDINIKGTPLSTHIDDVSANNLDLGVYPNPAHDKSIVTFNLLEKAKVSVALVDILGKSVSTLADNQQLQGGTYKYPFNTNEMAPGIYFVKLLVDDRLFVHKVLVQ